MSSTYSEAIDILNQIPKDKAGVVSFEYVVVAGAVVTAVVLAFGAFGGSGGALVTALTNALNAIIADLPGS